MRNLLTALPLPIRLALLDLSRNKGRALSFALLLTLVLGLLIPTLFSPRLSAIEANASEHLAQAQGFADSSAQGSLLVATFSNAPIDPQELKELFPQVAQLDTIALVPSTGTTLVNKGGKELPFSISAAAFSDPPLDQTLTALQGRLPSAAGEIAVDTNISAYYPEFESLLGTNSIGDSIVVLTGTGPVTLNVVGTFSSNLPPSGQLFGPVVGGPNTFEITEETQVQGFGFNKTELDMKAAIEMSQGFVNRLEPFSFRAPTTSLENAQEYSHLSLLLPGQSDQAAASFQAVTLALTLLFIAVVGIPLFALSMQNRQPELSQLRRAGASSFSLWLSLVVSALLIAVAAAGASIVAALGTLVWRFPDLSRHIVFSSEILAGVCVLAVVGAVVPAVVAASIPAARMLRQMERLDSNMPLASASSIQEAGSNKPVARGWVIAAFSAGATLLAFGIMGSLNATITNSSLVLFVCGAITLLIGVYLLVPRVLVVLTSRTQTSFLPLRLAVRELSRRPASTTNSIVPVVFLSAAITIFGIISRQHFLENDRSMTSGYAMVFPLLTVPLVAGILIIALTLGGSALGLGQLGQDRTALLNMGLDPGVTRKSEGFRAAIIAGVGITVGTLVGGVLAIAVLALRATSGGTLPLEIGALLAWETYLFAAVLPILLCYWIGKAAAGTSYQASLVSQP